MLDRDSFLRPIAHRGLHDATRGRVENSVSAFRAAIAKGYAIECDLQRSADGEVMVFHDFTLDRLTAETGAVAKRPSADLKNLRLAGTDDRIPTFTDLLEVVAGRAPLVVEIKSDWTALPADYLDRIVTQAAAYDGPLALMSFDPDVMLAIKERAPRIPRGIVAGVYRNEGWWSDVLAAERRERLSHLLECGPVAPAFISYHVKDLPTPVTRYVREVQRLPLICWTVRTADDRRTAQMWSDAPTFEGYEP